MREPIFGPNAKPLFVQAIIAIAVVLFLKWIGFDDLIHEMSGYVIRPLLSWSGICAYVTC